ncbi:MAG: helix-turn-helix transcriptional regulator [Anaerolineae bacterium]
MQPVRRRITEILQKNGSATVAELAQELKIAPVSVRHHLDILIGEDLVALVGTRRQSGAGRPSLVYALTPNALKIFPQRHDVLAGAVLSELKATLPADQVHQLLYRIGEKAAQEVSPSPPDQTIEKRLDQVTRFLCEKGYEAYWEACDDHYEIHTYNCPYAGVSEAHPELCQMDHAMMRYLLPGAIRLQSRAANGTSHCIYLFPNEKELPAGS